MSSKPITWGELAAERDALIDTVIAFERFRNALNNFDNAVYKGDAKAEVNEARENMYRKYDEVKPIVDKYRRNDG